MTEHSFYWHDYETFGTDPRRDRPVQFAGVRTDYDFNVIEAPLVVYAKPADDYLPDPEACLITGITPQLAQSKGVCEAEFIKAIHEQMARSNTCALGYNSLRFDDEVTRNTLYRNLRDPYQREWQHGNSRWDLIDVVRAARALRPEGVQWPADAEGVPVFRLEELTRKNGIDHQSAHDALSDVYATIAVAKLVRQAQPKLYRFLFEHRIKSSALALLQLGRFQPLIHISGKYPARKNCLAVVLPICQHPTNNNGIIVYDLSADPEPMLSLSAEDIKRRIFTPADQLSEGIERIPLKTVHVNKCPVLAPINVMRPNDEERLQVELSRCYENCEKIRKADQLASKIARVFDAEFGEEASDPDLMIYSGGFFNDSDKKQMAKIHATEPEQLARLQLNFSDSRLPEMFFRYRARNYPETLNADEISKWHEDCVRRLTMPREGRVSSMTRFLSKLGELETNQSVDRNILEALRQFANRKIKQFSIDI